MSIRYAVYVDKQFVHFQHPKPEDIVQDAFGELPLLACALLQALNST